MDANFLQQILGGLQPEDASINPYAAPPPGLTIAPPAAAPPVDLSAYLNGGAGNVFAQAAQPAPQPQAAPAPAPAPASAAPRPRHSVLDMIGRAADVFAKVGGAPEQYQPNIDAALARTNAADDRPRQVDLEKLTLATKGLELDTAKQAVIGNALRGLQAIHAANPTAAAGAWPILAQQAGIEPERAKALGEIFAQNPEAIDGLVTMFGGADKYSGATVTAVGADGKLHVFQPSTGAGPARDILPEGYSAVDPTQVINLGGATALASRGTGEIKRILPNTVRPDTLVTTGAQRDIAKGNNATAITVAGMNNASKETVAGMPARSKDGADGGSTDEKQQGRREALIALGNLRKGFQSLRDAGALPGQGSGLDAALGAISRGRTGQYLGEQFGSFAAQKRVEMQKTVNQLQQNLIKSLPAGAVRTKFEQEIAAKSLPDPSRMTYETANNVITDYENAYKRAIAAANRAEAGPAKPSGRTGGPAGVPVTVRPKKRVVPVTPRAAASSGGWSFVGAK